MAQSGQGPGTVLSYYADQCTGYLAATVKWIKAGWGNAAQWLQGASKTNKTGVTPVPGAIAVFRPGGTGNYDDPDGHVALVTGVNPDWQTFSVSEMNYTYGPGKIDTRNNAKVQDANGFIYPPFSDQVVAAFQNAKQTGKPPPVTTTFTPADLAGGTAQVQSALGLSAPGPELNPVAGAVSALTAAIGPNVIGVLEIGVGVVFTLAGVLLLGLVLFRSGPAKELLAAAGPAGKALSVVGKMGRASGAAKAAKPKTFDDLSPVSQEAAEERERAALRAEFARTGLKPKPGAAVRAAQAEVA